MRILTPPTGARRQTPQERLRALGGEMKGLIWGSIAGAAMVASMYAYNAYYEANLFDNRQAEMLEQIGTLHVGEPAEKFDSDFYIEMTNSVMGKLADATEDDYITLAEMAELETDVRKWKALKRAYGE